LSLPNTTLSYFQGNRLYLSQYITGTLSQQILSQPPSCCLGIIPLNLSTKDIGPVKTGHQPPQENALSPHLGIGSKGNLTPTLQPTQKGPFTFHRQGTLGVIQKTDQLINNILFSALNPQGPLADRREHYLRRQIFSDPSLQAHPADPGGGHDHRVEVLRLQLPDSGIKVPPQGNDSPSGVDPQKLGPSPEGGGPDSGLRGEFPQSPPLSGDQCISRILPLGYGPEVQARRKLGRDVFHAVHRQVDFPAQEGLFDLFDKEPLPPHLGEGHIGDIVPRGLDSDHLYMKGRMLLGDPLSHPCSLSQGERAPPGTDLYPLHSQYLKGCPLSLRSSLAFWRVSCCHIKMLHAFNSY
jgi:hypothetical protein